MRLGLSNLNLIYISAKQLNKDIVMAMSNEHQVTRQLKQRIADLAIAGIPIYLICQIVELDDDTVRKHYAKQLNTAQAEVVERIGRVVALQAESGDPKAQALYLKTQGAKFGWIEKQIVESVSSSDTQALKDKIAELEGKHDKDY